MPFTPNPGYTLNTTRIETWFERNRKHIALISQRDVLMVEWWDEAVDQAIEEGFLKIDTILGKVWNNGGAKLHETALAYYKEHCYPKTRISIHQFEQEEESEEKEESD